MRIALLIALGAPVAGAFAAAGADLRARRAVGVAALAAALVAGVVAVAQSSGRGEAAIAGLVAERWRLVLMLGALLGAAPALRAALRDERPSALDVALLAGVGATAASLLAGNTVSFGLLLAGSSLAFAVAAEACGGVRARRAAAAILASDALAILGLVLASGGGLTTPPEPGAGAASLLLAAAAVRLGLVPVAGALDDAATAHRALAATALGGVRAQGIVLLVWSLGGPAGIGRAALVLGAASAVWGAYRTAREGSLAAAATAHGGFVAIAFALGGNVSLWGGVLVAAAGFVTWPLLLAEGRVADLGRSGAALWAIGASLPGMALAGAAATAAGAARPAYLLVAAPLAAGAIALTAAAPRIFAPGPEHGSEPGSEGPEHASEAGPRWWWIAPAGAFALFAAILPARALSRVAVPAGEALGAPRLLRAPEGLVAPDRLGFWIGVLLIVGLLAWSPAVPSPLGFRLPRPHRWSAWWGAAPALPSERSEAGRARLYWEGRRWLAAAALAAGLLAATTLALYAAGVKRGFL